MITRYLILGLCIFSFSFSNAQIVEQIETASSNHSSESSTTQSSNTSSDFALEAGLDFLFMSMDLLSYSFAHRRFDSTYKYSSLDFSYRQSLADNGAALAIPQIDYKLGFLYGSLRVTQLSDEGIKENQKYQTLDFQFAGFQTNPNSRVVFNLSSGVLTELQTGNVFSETVAGLQVRLNSKSRLYAEGRTAIDQGQFIRNEATVGGRASITKIRNANLTADAFYTASRYYEQVNVKGFGFGLGLRF